MVRHSETEFNKERRLQGFLDSPLTKQCREHARQIAGALKKRKFDFIYSSDLGRALTTAQIIKDDLNFSDKIKTSKSIREVNMGKLGGQLHHDVVAKYPEFMTLNFVNPGGESFKKLQQRVIRFLHNLEKKHGGKTILIVTHSSCVRIAICLFKNLDFGKNLMMPISHTYVGKFVLDKGKLISYKKM
jgi:probable phosphoglycerate mutase